MFSELSSVVGVLGTLSYSVFDSVSSCIQQITNIPGVKTGIDLFNVCVTCGLISHKGAVYRSSSRSLKLKTRQLQRNKRLQSKRQLQRIKQLRKVRRPKNVQRCYNPKKPLKQETGLKKRLSQKVTNLQEDKKYLSQRKIVNLGKYASQVISGASSLSRILSSYCPFVSSVVGVAQEASFAGKLVGLTASIGDVATYQPGQSATGVSETRRKIVACTKIGCQVAAISALFLVPGTTVALALNYGAIGLGFVHLGVNTPKIYNNVVLPIIKGVGSSIARVAGVARAVLGRPFSR